MQWIMKVVEKRDYIHSHLHLADARTIDQFYEVLRKEERLKATLSSRAKKSERDIQNGHVHSREELEKNLDNIGLE
ncbi:hypothetical protein DMA11_19100 [Marinilabiliaceae bacterium JC017]|nr:hypothetical protein DMA11_19100 [Marinilabiliaceae bacterium JC017]